VLRYALGLALVRLKRIDEALGELERERSLQAAGKAAAAKATVEALAAHPDDANVRAVLASFMKDDQH
jgi:hypothetical protein